MCSLDAELARKLEKLGLWSPIVSLPLPLLGEEPTCVGHGDSVVLGPEAIMTGPGLLQCTTYQFHPNPMRHRDYSMVPPR
jgi:hypothetical protein